MSDLRKNEARRNQESSMSPLKGDASPQVSVVMPVYNSIAYLDSAIQSVLSQTFGDFEFIIVDDASSDGCWDLICAWAEKDSRIRLYRNEQNQGIAETRNRGIALATGKYVATQDSDDLSRPDRFAQQVRYLDDHPSCAVVGGFLEIVDSEGKVLGYRKYSDQDHVLRRRIFFHSPIAQPASMIRRSMLQKAGLYNKRYPPAEDLDLWFRLGKEGAFGNIQDVAIQYRYYGGSATTTNTRLIEKLSLEIRFLNRKNPSFRFGLKEAVYNLLHWISLYVVPSRLKMWMFMRLRDEKLGPL